MRNRLKLLLSAAAALLLSVASAQYADLVAAAQAEGSLELYANITAIDPVLEAFAAEYGVDANYTRISSEGFAATLLSEYHAGQQLAAVLQPPIPPPQGLEYSDRLQPYASPAAAHDTE